MKKSSRNKMLSSEKSIFLISPSQKRYPGIIKGSTRKFSCKFYCERNKIVLCILLVPYHFEFNCHEHVFCSLASHLFTLWRIMEEDNISTLLLPGLVGSSLLKLFFSIHLLWEHEHSSIPLYWPNTNQNTRATSTDWHPHIIATTKCFQYCTKNFSTALFEYCWENKQPLSFLSWQMLKSNHCLRPSYIIYTGTYVFIITIIINIPFYSASLGSVPKPEKNRSLNPSIIYTYTYTKINGFMMMVRRRRWWRRKSYITHASLCSLFIQSGLIASLLLFSAPAAFSTCLLFHSLTHYTFDIVLPNHYYNCTRQKHDTSYPA